MEDTKPAALSATGGAALQKAASNSTVALENANATPIAMQVPGVLGTADLQEVERGGAGAAVGLVAGGLSGSKSTTMGALHGSALNASASGVHAGGQIHSDVGAITGAGSLPSTVGLDGGGAPGAGAGAADGTGSAAGGRSAGAGGDARTFPGVANAGDAASAVPVIGTSRLLQTIGGTEMRVGLHSQEFGSISIATSLSAGSIATQILLEHAALGHALTAHLPAMAEKLQSALGMPARVEVRDSGMGAQAQQESSGSGTAQGGAGAGGQGQAAGLVATRMAGLGAITDKHGLGQLAALGQSLQGGTGRLSIRA